MSAVGLKNMGFLDVKDANGTVVYGGSQYWYPKGEFFAGGACGATTAANILAYILRSRHELLLIANASGLGGLAEPTPETGAPGENIAANDKTGYIGFMKTVYRYFSPSMIGLHFPWFVKGVARIAKERDLPVSAVFLNVPLWRPGRSDFSKTAGFIRASLDEDIPVAFLALSTGGVENLYKWHWVTIIGLDEDNKRVKVLDNTKTSWTDLGRWLSKSVLGGTFVRITVPDGAENKNKVIQ